MGMMRFVLVAGVLVLAGCGGDDGGSDDGGDTATTLRPAGDVITEGIVDAAVPAGEPLDVEGLRLTVSDMAAAPDADGFRLQVSVRAENSGEEDLQLPNIGIVCSGSDEMGGPVVGSEVLAGDAVPAGSFLEGTMYLLVPGDLHTSDEAPPCAEPAVVQAQVFVYTDETPVWAWSIPAGLLPA